MRQLLGAAGAAVLLTGCPTRHEFAAVEGVVTLDGVPLDDIEVVFLPEPGAARAGPRSTCITDASGVFRMRTDAGKDGAVVGACRVTLLDLKAIAAAPDGPGKSRPSRVPAEYVNATSTPMRNVTVTSGAQTLNFEVGKAKGK